MRKWFLPFALLSTFGAAGAAVAEAPPAAAVATSFDSHMAAEPAPVSELIEEIDIPYEEFTLDNGLTVIVHEDRKAPVVAVSVWYNVGSKDEPPGKTGFAHLFEHIMFNGTENVPGEFFEPLRRIGATDVNGTTWFDRTNYFQTVPTPALEMALFLESDRMGHLLGAVTQETLDNQRGVVQNEKRQGDNQPYGLVEYVQLDALPDGHPYAHSTIGSMADLDAATLDDVKNWFREKYGPNNAVLVLAGDIDAETARPLVEKYFGDIPRGPQNVPAEAEVVTLDEPQHVEMQDRVANVRLYRNWVTPGLLEPEETIPLEVGLAVLGGLSSSKLDNILVRQEKTATRVSAFLQDFHRIGFAEVQVDVKPGEDADAVARRLDQIIDWFIEVGPTEDEVQRVVTSALANRIKGLEQVGGFRGKATALAEGELYAGDPAYYKKQLEIFAAVTPEEVRAAMQKWLTKPELSIRVVPGERGEYEEAASVETSITQHPRFYRLPEEGERPLAPVRYIAPRTPPEVGVIADLDFPDIERAQLSNGIEVVYARRDVVPVTQIALEFDAGHAADPRDKLGTQTLMLNLLDEGGAGGMDSIEIAEAKERLGASISTGASLDRTAVVMSALTPNLGPSLDLMAAIVKEPMFDPEELERLRAQQLAGIAQELTNPQAIGFRALPPLIYGPEHPYGIPFTGSGDPELLPSVTREDLVAFHQRWIRPDKAKIFIVSDRPLIELMPLVERHFGEWSPPDVPGGEKRFAAAPPTPRPRIVLVDRPQSPQSLILGGYVTPLAGTDNPLEFNIANEALGGSFLSRINMDLRETKGWSYGARGLFLEAEQLSPYVIFAPVQADRTGDSIAALQGQIERFLTQEGVTEDELARAVAGNVRELPGNFETSGAVLSALRAIELYDRPDDYYEALPARYRAMTRAELDAAARAALDPGNIVWLVVGDAEQVRPQLERLGMPIEEASLQ